MENVITKLFKESGMSVRDFAAAAGLKYSTAYDIVHGKTSIENIGAGAFVRIAHVFDTTADALISGMGEKLSSPLLSRDEQQLISLYRNMDPDYRRMLLKSAVAYEAMTEKSGDGAVLDDGVLGIALK